MMERVVTLKLFATLAIAAAITLVSAQPSAADVVWSFQDVAFDDGGTLSGTVTTDDSGDVLSYDFATTTTGSFTGQVYDSAAADNLFTQDTLTEIRFIDANAVWVDISINVALTSGAGSLAITLGNEAYYNYPSTTYRTIITGALVEQLPVPEPLSLAVFGAGLFGLAAVRRRI